MKLSREARRTARELFQLSLRDGRVDERRVRTISEQVATEKPRDYLGILKELARLVRLELSRRHADISTASPVGPADAEKFKSALRSRFGSDLTTSFSVDPSLLGGVRVQVGSDVWDGSLRARLESLTKHL